MTCARAVPLHAGYGTLVALTDQSPAMLKAVKSPFASMLPPPVTVQVTRLSEPACALAVNCSVPFLGAAPPELETSIPELAETKMAERWQFAVAGPIGQSAPFSE